MLSVAVIPNPFRIPFHNPFRIPTLIPEKTKDAALVFSR